MKDYVKTDREVIICGAGLAGLALACRLAAKNYKVQVFEKNTYIGGKATTIGNERFTWDAGPSLFTMPSYVDEVFNFCGRNPRDYYTYSRLEILCNYYFNDGTFLAASANKDKFANELADKLGVPAHKTLSFLKEAARIHELTEEVFIRKSLHSLKTYLSGATLRGLMNFNQVHAFDTMADRIFNHFREERVTQLFCRYATYNGSNPFKAPATLNVIPHLEYGIGAYMPEGGIHAIPMALFRLAEELGVEFHLGRGVDEIVVEKQQVIGIRSQDEFYHAEKVVSNIDVVPTYRKLLSSVQAPEKTLAQERSSSALIFYWGIESEFRELDVHNIFFSANYKEEFHSLFDDLTINEDPTVYVHVSSKICKAHAPKGGENWFVMVNAPTNNGQDWEQLIKRTRENILAKLEKTLGRSIRSLISYESMLSPEMIESRTGSFGGSLYGTSSNNRFAAFLRHPNKSKKIKGLYFCGGSVHPGGGIPMVMSSAKIVSTFF